MSKISNVNWECELSLTRAEVVALGLLSEFVGNLEQDYKKQFPSGIRDCDFNQVRSAFRKMSALKAMDDKLYADISRALTQLNVQPGEANL